jgi:hypothetical protein
MECVVSGIADLVLGDQLVLHINRKLGVVADADLGHARHGTGIRIGQRDLVLAGLVQFIKQRLVAIPLAFDRCDLFREFAIADVRAVPIATGFLLLRITLIKPPHVIRQFLVSFVDELGQRTLCEVAILVVHRLDAGSIDGQKLSSEQIELPAQDDELPEHLPESRPVHTAEIGDSAEVRLQVPQQPDHLDIAMGLRLQPPAGSHPVDVAVHVELQKIGRIITRTAGFLRRHTHEAGGVKVKAIDKGLDEADRIVRPHVIIHRFRQKQQLRAICS